MPKLDLENHFEEHGVHYEPAVDDLALDRDLVMEQILDNLNHTPLGQVLKNIAQLPEIRRGKVLGVREQLKDGSYDLNGRLDDALEKVLEDLTP